MAVRILVPFDDSEPARAAIEEAVDTFTPDEIIVLHVIDTGEFSIGPEGGAAQSIYEARKARAEELVGEAKNKIDGSEVSVETVLETGTPGNVIVDYAKTHDVDYIVMGSHGRSGLSRILLGSVAERVLRGAPVSVMIVRTDSDD